MIADNAWGNHIFATDRSFFFFFFSSKSLLKKLSCFRHTSISIFNSIGVDHINDVNLSLITL